MLLTADQAKCILLDPYANAFNFEAEGSPWVTDTTYKLGFLGTQINGMTMKLHERKFELDSLCAFLRLSTRYYNATKDSTPFTRSGGEWLQAVEVVLSTMREQQKGMAEEQAQANPAYYFQRSSAVPTGTILLLLHAAFTSALLDRARVMTHALSCQIVLREVLDTLMHGVGVPGRRCGLVKSPFRPSDGSCLCSRCNR